MLAVVVEDEWPIRMQIVDTLVDAGWEVEEFASGERALEFLGEGRDIAFLVTDIRLSGALTGWDVAEGYHNANPGMKIIYCSGTPPDTTRQLPDSEFMSKPCQMGAILEMAPA